MARLGSFFIIALLFCFSLSHAARPPPVFHDSTPHKIHPQVGVEAKNMRMEKGCEGETDEECLMRSTKAAHLDYIYTQEDKP